MTANSKQGVSRRQALERGAAAVAGAASVLTATGSAAAQTAAGTNVTPSSTRRVFRAFVRFGTGASIQELRLLPISPRQVVVRTEAAQICYTTTSQALGTSDAAQAVIPGHGGVGTVIEVGPQVTRVEVGDRVIVAGGPQCGECYHCLHGRADRCLMANGGGPANAPIAEMRDGLPVAGFRGGCSELMVTFEDSCVPIFTG